MESILPLLRIRIFSKQADSPNVAMNHSSVTSLLEKMKCCQVPVA